MDFFLGVIEILVLLIVVVVWCFIVLIGRDKKPGLYSIIIGIILSVIEYIGTMDDFHNILDTPYLLYFLLIFLLYYVSSIITYKITNAIDSNSKILFLIEWGITFLISVSLCQFFLKASISSLL